jgi:regulatory protein
VSPRKPRQPPSLTVDAIETAALRYLARSDRTEAQVKGYLVRLGASAARAQALIRRFQERGYLDDAGYARRWARDRLTRKPMGRDRLEAELIAKGVTPLVAAETLDELYSDEHEQTLAETLARRASVTPAFLRGRGFQEDVIEAVLGGIGREDAAGGESSAARRGRPTKRDSVGAS